MTKTSNKTRNARDARIRESIRTGSTFREVAEQHGVTYQRVQQIWAKNPQRRLLTGYTRKTIVSKEKHEKVREFIRAGADPDDVAETFGYARASIRVIATGLLGQKKREEVARVIEMRKSGMRVRDIAKVMNRDYQTTSSLLWRHGVTSGQMDIPDRRPL